MSQQDAAGAHSAIRDDSEGMRQFNTLPRRILVVYLPLAVFVFVLLFPFYWMAITAVKPDNQLTNYEQYSPFWVVRPTLEHIKYLLFETSYPGWLWNTMLVSVASTVIALAASVFAAYAIERVRFSGARVTGLLIFLAYLVPPSILFIPLAFIVFQVGIFDSRLALILTYPTFLIPFCTWLLMGYFRTIPFELEESALVDGATRWQILTKVVLPLAVPGLISAGIFAFTLSWNEVHLRADLHLLLGEQDRAGRRADRAGARRHLRVGGADGRRAARLATGGDPLFILRRLLRLVDDGCREGVAAMAGKTQTRVAVIGLGSMGMGAAKSCLAAGLATYGIDPRNSACDELLAAGAVAAGAGGRAFAGELDAVVVLTVNAAQCREALFGERGIAPHLKPGTAVMVSATISVADAKAIAADLEAAGLAMLDAPVSGGPVKAAAGDMTVMAAGPAPVFEALQPVLDAVAGKVYRISDTIGDGATVKIIHQLLAGVHIAAGAEAMALAAKAGIPLETMYDVVTHAAGNSWMFENRMRHVVDGDYTPTSMVDIFVKDLGLVTETGLSMKFPLPLATTAYSMFATASQAGYGQLDDSAVIKVFPGITLPGDDPQG
jgi:3-hydroxyisobutyrate dehydrogenase-like beta-hydroxyacid dehydrogenase/ABC-type glycerol-3-phosphate transport system permease component